MIRLTYCRLYFRSGCRKRIPSGISSTPEDKRSAAGIYGKLRNHSAVLRPALRLFGPEAV
jgi:hypothetical protein